MNKHNKKQKMSEKDTTYTCSMHAQVRREKAGLCTECGMNLIAIEESRHRAYKKGENVGTHAGHTAHIFKIKFLVSLILSVPVVLYSGIGEKLFNWIPPFFPGSVFIPFFLSSIILFYAGWIFIASAWRELKAKMPGMMTLISLAILTAYIYSTAVTITGGTDVLFWELATLITIMLLGHWMEMRAVQGARGALKEISQLLPDRAEVVQDERINKIALSELKKGDILFIRPGTKIPADAEVTEGISEINESMVSGESKPVQKNIGDTIIAGTVNGNGALKARVTSTGDNTFLAGIARLVQEAEASKSKLQLLSDRAAYYLTLVAIGIGFITFVSWSFADSGVAFALTRLVAVLVIACPHALGLAIPLVASISTKMAARNGFLVKRRLALEMARNVDVVLFDKTGTLTKGEYGITHIWRIGIDDENTILQKAASVDAYSEHYVSQAIVRKAKEEKITISSVKNFTRIPGKGVEGIVDGIKISVGGSALLNQFSTSLADSVRKEIEKESMEGKTIVYVFGDEKLIGAFSLGDMVRSESYEAVKQLKNLGIRVSMITGDSEQVAKWTADKLEIEEYFSHVLPNEKADKIKLLQSKGNRVAMIGDGINDAPALTQADLGIAIGAGTNIAIESAGIILVKNDPRDIPKIIKLSRLTYAKMIQNLFWAAGYNVVALPLAAGVLVSKGILLQPAIAALFMSLSTVIVAINAVLLKRKKLV